MKLFSEFQTIHTVERVCLKIQRKLDIRENRERV